MANGFMYEWKQSKARQTNMHKKRKHDKMGEGKVDEIAIHALEISTVGENLCDNDIKLL